MGLFGRLFNIGKGKANDAVDALEEKNMDTVIRQSIRNMEEELAKTVKASAEAMGAAQQIKAQYEAKVRVVKDWTAKATEQVKAGNDELAAKALVKKNEAQAQADIMKPAVKNADKACEALKQKVKQFKAKIAQAKNDSKTLIARNHAAAAQKKLASAASGIGAGSDSAFSQLERFKERVDANEAEANAWDELSGDADDDLDAEFAASSSASVDDELAALKAKMNK